MRRFDTRDTLDHERGVSRVDLGSRVIGGSRDHAVSISAKIEAIDERLDTAMNFNSYCRHDTDAELVTAFDANFP